jgi:hypothetical protein
MPAPEMIRHRNQLAAELKLALIANHEDLAEIHDEEASPKMRDRYAAMYRRVVGVHPEQRRKFAEELRPIAESGNRTVNELIDSLDVSGHVNGSSPAAAAGG